MLETREVYVLS